MLLEKGSPTFCPSKFFAHISDNTPLHPLVYDDRWGDRGNVDCQAVRHDRARHKRPEPEGIINPSADGRAIAQWGLTFFGVRLRKL